MRESCSRSSTMVITRARPSQTTNPTETPENGLTRVSDKRRHLHGQWKRKLTGFHFMYSQIRQENYFCLLWNDCPLFTYGTEIPVESPIFLPYARVSQTSISIGSKRERTRRDSICAKQPKRSLNPPAKSRTLTSRATIRWSLLSGPRPGGFHHLKIPPWYSSLVGV
jgi:hypothetical protein